MSDKSNFSRRSILKGTVGAGIGTAGFSSEVFAKKPPNQKVFNKVRKSNKVQSILDELGEKNLQYEDAETTELSGDSLSLKRVEFDLGYGSLFVGLVNENQVDTAFKFDQESDRTAPNSEYSDVPKSTSAWLYAKKDNVVFYRTATSEEKKAALSRIEKANEDNAIVYLMSDSTNVYVEIPNPSEESISTDEINYSQDSDIDALNDPSQQTQKIVRYTIETTQEDGTFSPASATIQPSGVVDKAAREIAETVIKEAGFASLDELTDTCADETIACAVGIAGQVSGCLRCAPVCTTSITPVTGALCVLCLYGVCSWILTGASCIGAVDCFSNA
ncbi:hypothetical protein [Haloferax larsenii]|uniref:Uncharacterized protein n=1 Tax=Haloferax larsenii TaxID=302484 RepID=A0A1H7PD09_HALLR|nr:hypothetical protein [Haloferax larsenii]SEL33539.1 hypothetical protein SAMN04488691_10453 [Haloferax larsenii]